MSRALRRQPMIQKPPARSPSFRPATSRPQKQSAAAAAEAARKRSLLERLPLGRSIQDVISELKKVSWPTREETTRLTIAVIVVAAVIGLLLGGVDLGFNWLVEQLLLR
jgi:preprotein translocase subunit SecE